MDVLMTTSLPPQQAVAALQTSPPSTAASELSRQSSRESGGGESAAESVESVVNRVSESPAMDELDQLGNRLEKFVSSAATTTSSRETSPKSLLPTPARRSSAGSHIPRPEIGPKPAFLASLAISRNFMTQSMKSPTKSKSPPAAQTDAKATSSKSSGTASILKSTLRRMTRLSINTTSRDKSADSSNVSPEEKNAKGGVVNRKRGGVSPSSTSVSRSRSFKEPEPYASSRATNGGIVPRNMPLSSSLRRPRNKDRDDGQNRSNFQRSGTGGTLERKGVNRSHSVAGAARRQNNNKDMLVKKSRAIQTQLTRDTMNDDLVDDAMSIPTNIDFNLHMPDLLGSDVDMVETHLVEHTEPVDVRKNRQLTLDNMRLQREVERLKMQVGENDHLKKELRSVKSKLEEEQKSRVKIEAELDRHNDKVRMIAQSMDCVEKQFETRDDNIHSLMRRLQDSNLVASRLQSDLDCANDVIGTLQSEVERSLAQQKVLLRQCQEAEMEARELQEFLQAEKMTLAETLKVRSIVCNRSELRGGYPPLA
jgi:hypothetical protein